MEFRRSKSEVLQIYDNQDTGTLKLLMQKEEQFSSVGMQMLDHLGRYWLVERCPTQETELAVTLSSFVTQDQQLELIL